MGRLRMKSIRELNKNDLEERLQQMRAELTKLRVDAGKGTLRKESGKLKPLRKDIARIMTRLGELEKNA